jgi:hypothetical protein
LLKFLKITKIKILKLKDVNIADLEKNISEKIGLNVQ